MATRTCVSKGGGERLVISTICTHLPFFHEAGFEFRTERRRRVPPRLWNPATWTGFVWSVTGEAAQPTGLRCVFFQGDGAEREPADFAATAQRGDGYLKLSCDHMVSRLHCVHVVRGEQPRSVAPPDMPCNDARSVTDVRLHFTYDGQAHTIAHARGSHAAPPATHADNASTRTR